MGKEKQLNIFTEKSRRDPNKITREYGEPAEETEEKAADKEADKLAFAMTAGAPPEKMTARKDEILAKKKAKKARENLKKKLREEKLL